MMLPKNQLTQLIEHQTQLGSSTEVDFEFLYDSFRRIAQSMMNMQPQNHTLQATALVNEAYLKLDNSRGELPTNKNHLIALASITMRQLLVDHARAKNTLKRASAGHRVTLSDIANAQNDLCSVDVLALHEALLALESINQRQAELVQLKFFGGLTLAEASEVMGVSTATLERDWRVARAWLASKIDLEHTHE